MGNFAKPLQDASDEELMQWINTLDPNFTVLASDELTRRQNKRLEESNTKLQKIMLGLTGVATAVTIFTGLQAIFDAASQYLIYLIPTTASTLISGVAALMLTYFLISYLTQKDPIRKEKAYSLVRLGALSTTAGAVSYLIYFFVNFFSFMNIEQRMEKIEERNTMTKV
jgi:hypothetical protein